MKTKLKCNSYIKPVLPLLIVLLFSYSGSSQKVKTYDLKIGNDYTVHLNGKKVNPKKVDVPKKGKTIYALTLEKEGFKKEYNAISNLEQYNYKSIIPIHKRTESQRFVEIDKTPFDVPIKQYQMHHWHITQYNKNIDEDFLPFRRITNDKNTKKVEIYNSVFTGPLNDKLKKNSLQDSTITFFAKKYSNIELIGICEVADIYNVTLKENAFIQSVIDIRWIVKDVMFDTIYTEEYTAYSGKFLYLKDKSKDEKTENIEEKSPSFDDSKEDALYFSLLDAYEASMYEFILDTEVQDILNTKLIIENKELDFVSKPTTMVSSLESAMSASVTVKTNEGHGSGFFISNDGYILTNQHVVDEAKTIEIIKDGKKVKAEVIRVSKVADLALLKTEMTSEFAFPIPTESIGKIGQTIFAIGTPKSLDLPATLSKGIISSLRKSGENETMIQTDVGVNFGNSGGPFVNEEGKLVGIVNSKMAGFGVEGISFGLAAEQIFSHLNIEYK